MILILGVTASGKGRLAFDLAQAIGAEIISIDSMKAYRRMDIGTAKPSIQNRRLVKHHLIDIIEPSESFNVGLFLELATGAIERVNSRGRPVIAVGGTALYIKALLYGLFEGPGTDSQIRSQLRKQAKTQGTEQLHRQLKEVDPLAAQNIHPNDSKRIIRALEVYKITGKPISALQQQWNSRGLMDHQQSWTIIGLRREKAEQARRINKRVKKMLEQGLVDEVESLLAEDEPLSQQARCAIGYAEIIDYLNGKTTLQEATELIKKNTRRFAKNQRTWFKTFKNVTWLNIEAEEPTEKIFSHAKQLLSQNQ